MKKIKYIVLSIACLLCFTDNIVIAQIDNKYPAIQIEKDIKFEKIIVDVKKKYEFNAGEVYFNTISDKKYDIYLMQGKPYGLAISKLNGKLSYCTSYSNNGKYSFHELSIEIPYKHILALLPHIPFEFIKIIELPKVDKRKLYQLTNIWINKTYDRQTLDIPLIDTLSSTYKIVLKPNTTSNLTRIGFLITYNVEINIKDEKIKLEITDAHCYENGNTSSSKKNDLGLLAKKYPIEGFITQNKWVAIQEDIELQFNRILTSFENIKNYELDDF